MTIKYLVIQGGGENGFITQGILTKSHEMGLWNIDNIKSVYGVSSGSIIAAMLCLKYDFDTINEYLLNRPFKFFKFDVKKILTIVNEMGCYDKTHFIEIFKPLLLARDLPINVTLKQLYDYSNIKLTIFSTNVTKLEGAILAYDTTPDIELMDALIMSCNIPIVFKPVYYNDDLYVDGGVVNAFPIDYCLKQNNCEPDEILGIKNKCEHQQIANQHKITSIYHYITLLFTKMIFYLNKTNRAEDITKFRTLFQIDNKTLQDQSWEKLMETEYRKSLFSNGQSIVEEFSMEQHKTQPQDIILDISNTTCNTTCNTDCNNEVV